jgi:deoxyinosine 3'endonuclease (endonuclease V)
MPPGLPLAWKLTVEERAETSTSVIDTSFNENVPEQVALGQADRADPEILGEPASFFALEMVKFEMDGEHRKMAVASLSISTSSTVKELIAPDEQACTMPVPTFFSFRALKALLSALN